MSVYGYYTKRDLTTIGTLAFFWLLGIIVAWVTNLFIGNTMVDLVVACVWVVVFIALIAYDTQKIKEFNIIGNEWTEEDRKEAILWTLSLYLDFINLFLKLLRLFWKRR
jgi:FtsH-binding integral membrane protein